MLLDFSNWLTTKKEDWQHSTPTLSCVPSAVYLKQKHVTLAKRNVRANQHGIVTRHVKRNIGNNTETNANVSLQRLSDRRR